MARRTVGPVHILLPLLRRLHFYAGILVAPFLVVATVSGAMYALAPTAEQFVYRDYLHAQHSGPARPLAEQVAAAGQVLPLLTASAVQPGVDGATTRVLFDDPLLGESARRAVFVDPASARPQDTLVVYGSAGALPLRTWISEFHRNLHLGEPGRLYSELAASWLWVIALGGAVLWIQRFRQRRSAGLPARLFTVDRSTPGSGPRRRRQRTLDWHGAVGLWLVVGLVFLSATGLTWSRYAGDNVTSLRQTLSWTAPTLDDGLARHHVRHDAGRVEAPEGPFDPDLVASAAARAGLDGPIEISIPSDRNAVSEVKQLRVPWQFSPDSIAVDPANGAVTDRVRFSDWPIAAMLADWGIALHMGILFGWMNQLALFVLCVGLLTVIARGYLMWWRRRPRARAPRVTNWRAASWPVVAALVLGTIAVGWFLPLLGLSLAAFLVAEAAIRRPIRR